MKASELKRLKKRKDLQNNDLQYDVNSLRILVQYLCLLVNKSEFLDLLEFLIISNFGPHSQPIIRLINLRLECFL